LGNCFKEVLKIDTAIQKAQERMTFVTNDKESLRAYDMREMAMSDYTSGMNFARREGRQEGISIGEERGKLEIAMNMEKNGMDAHQIMILTNLSEDEIRRL
jgi:predicted transposase/invertase (TIGR01784 family)